VGLNWLIVCLVTTLANVSTEYVSAAIDELTCLVGIKENIALGPILNLPQQGNLLGCIQAVANHLELPCTFTISVSNKFESTALVPFSSTTRGAAGITAQVHIPSQLPLYGSLKLQGFPIRLTVSGDCRRSPETFIAILAHELSHVVLSALWHKQKDNEFYTDLTAMILGFSDIIRRGRKIVVTKQTSSTTTTTTTTTYGYLSDSLFDFAFQKIQQKLTEERNLNLQLRNDISHKVTGCKDHLMQCREQLLLMNNLTSSLGKNPNKRIRKEDIQKIIQVHQLNYVDGFEASRNNKEQRLKEITKESTKFLRNAQHYTKQEKESLRNLQQKINNLCLDIVKDLETMNREIEVLRRYTGFFSRFKIK